MADSMVKKESDKIARLAEVTMGAGGVGLTNLAQALEFCDIVISSSLAPSDMNTRAKVFVAIQYGAELGLSPMQALQSVYIVKGRPSLSYKAALGLARRNGYDGEVGTRGDGDDRCGYMTIPGKPDVEFYVADAKKAGLWGSNTWAKYPDDMLIARAVSRGINRYLSHVLMGCEVAEMVRDIEPKRAQLVEVEPQADELIDALLADDSWTVEPVDTPRPDLITPDDGSVPADAEGHD